MIGKLYGHPKSPDCFLLFISENYCFREDYLTNIIILIPWHQNESPWPKETPEDRGWHEVV